MEVDKVVVVVKIINLNAVFWSTIDIFDVIVVVEISLDDVVEVVVTSWLGSGGAVLGRRFDFGYGDDFVEPLFARPAAPGPVDAKVIHDLWTVLDVAGRDGERLLLGVTVDSCVSGAGYVTATYSTSTSQRTLQRRQDATSDD